MFYVYILKSQKDRKLYIGQTDDLKRRFSEHAKGRVDATRARRPFKLVYYEAYLTRDDAVLREKSFKKSGSVYNGLIKRIHNSIEDC